MVRHSEVYAIAKRELRSFFNGPVAYIVIALFLLFTGFFFFTGFFRFNQAEMRELFQLMPLMLSLVIPAVTMRLLSEERQSGSFEMLATLPVSSAEIALGKFMAGALFSILMVSPTLVYLGTILLLGSPDPGPVIGGYTGVVFLCAAYTSIGLLVSSFTKNQIVSFITAWAACFGLWLMDKVVIFLPSKFGIISFLGTDFHFQNIARGVIDSRDIVYFISLTLLALIFTVRAVEERR